MNLISTKANKETFIKTNLKRVRRLRKIISDNCDYGKDRLDFLNDPKRFRKIIERNTIANSKIYNIIYKIGPPKFIKRQFNVATSNKFKSYTGVFFGVNV